ncbi:MAG: TonB-dependent receptor [Ignavibacteriaceae bacterium]
MKNIFYCWLFLIFLLQGVLAAQADSYIISGFVTDAVTGEAIVGANILLFKDSLNFNEPPITGTSTNKFGYYVIPSLKEGEYYLIVRYIGFKTNLSSITIGDTKKNIVYPIELTQENIKLEEVIVEGKRTDIPISSTIDVSPELLAKLPTMSGEVDLFKSLELLPGVNKSSEISSGLYIRGGSPDQTLTLVDGVIVYNPAHLGNIASTFNSNAISDLRLIKGAFPAEYGSRLSSVLDIKLRSGTKERNKGTIGLGVINSYASFEGPLEENSTYMVSGRYMYYDILQKNFSKNSTVPRYNFYDVNAKVNYILSENNILSISGLYSKDHVYNPPQSSDTDYEMDWKNVNLSLNWIQVNKRSLLLNSIISFINYEFSSKIGINPNTITPYTYYSNPNLTDFYFRQNAEIRWLQNHTFKTGFDIALHNYDILYSDVYNDALEKDPYAGKDINSIEASLYFQSESRFTEDLSANVGGRLYYFNAQRLIRFEPRIAASYQINQNLVMKGAFAIANQFLHLIVRNDITLPTDLWYPSTKNIQPSKATQYVFGFDSFWLEREYIFTVEGFYKEMKNLYEFKNAPQLNPLDDSIEDQFTSGQGEAYGVEFFLNKTEGKFSGWIGYTLSWSVRQFDELNGGKKYYSKYDRRNDFSLVLSYRLLDDLNLGLTWIYATGQRYTTPPGQFIFDPIGIGGNEEIQFNYMGINTTKFPAYHKLDLNITYSFKVLNVDIDSYINIYNVYNRHNAFAQYVVIEKNEEGEELPVVKRITLFPFIPSAGLAIKF